MHEIKQPLVSVVIPTIPKRKQLLDRALRSVHDQTYKNIEIIVVNEGKPSNVQRNIGIERSHGEYIAFLDDDDYWMPTKIEQQINALQQHPDCVFSVCYSYDMRFNHERVNRPPEHITHGMLIKSFNLSSTSAFLIQRKVLIMIYFDDGYYFDEELPASQEYDLAIRLSKHGGAYCVPQVLIKQYASENQISENWGKKIQGVLGIFRKHHEEYTTLDYLKTIGVLGLFTLGYVFGNKIYRIIIPVKEIYEDVG